MELLITENKGFNFPNTMVRIFLQKDYWYGYWISEHFLFNQLNEDQRKKYLDSKEHSCYIDIDYDTAFKLLECGVTPYTKQVLVKE